MEGILGVPHVRGPDKRELEALMKGRCGGPGGEGGGLELGHLEIIINHKGSLIKFWEG